MVKQTTESKDEIIKVQTAVKESAKLHTEHEERDRSIIMFNCKESTEKFHAKRSEKDLEFVKDFIDNGLNISPQEIQSCFRLGFYKDNAKRPLKITFVHKSNQVKVMEHLFRLRNSEQIYKDISVCIDKTKSEREALKSLIKEAEQRTINSTDKRYVVRGTYNPYIAEKRL